MARSPDTDDLSLELHYGHDLIQTDVLILLQEVLAARSPKFHATLEVHAYERDKNRRLLDPGDPESLRDAALARGTERGPTYHALAAQRGTPAGERRFGSVLARGRGRGAGGRFLSVSFDTMTPARKSGSTWLWSNSIGLTVSTAKVEGQPRADWVASVATDLAAHEDFLWGSAHLRREFHAGNLDTTHGMAAIGRDVRQHLPGLYWLNLFGQPYVELIGSQALMDAGAAAVAPRGHTVALRAWNEPEDWEDHLDTKGELLTRLGSDIFFDRSQPNRKTRAPDFGLSELAESRPFQVMTTDGKNFKVLP